MRFLVDENIKKKLTLFLRESGHEVVYAEKGLRNSSLVTRARDEGRVLLTHDTDFLNTALYPPALNVGIVVVRIHPPGLEAMREACKQLFARVVPGDFSGALFVLTNEGVEIVK